MRILTIVIAGLALMTAGCASRTTPSSSAQSAAPAQSGAATTTTTSGVSGDRIDQWAAAVERERMMKR